MINSNEAMLVLNKLPNIQILNGRSTKEEDTEEEDDEEEATGSNNNNHLYVGMEQIEEVKNLESNSNYLSDNNNAVSNNINSTPTNKGKEDLENLTQSSQKNNINVDEEVNENEEESESNHSSPQSNKKEENNKKEPEPIKEFSIKNEKNEKTNLNSKSYIDISKIELSSLALPTPSLNSSFEHLLSSFSSILSVNKSQSQSTNYQSLHYQELSQIESNKSQYENYMYALYLINSKFKIIKTVLNDTLPLITSKIPELSTNDILSNLLNELFTSCDVAVNLITYLNPRIKEFSSSYESLQSKLSLLSKQINDDKSILEKKISQLDSENRLMTDRIFKKASSIIQNNNTTTIETNTIMNTINNVTPPLLTSNISTPPYNNTVSNNRRTSKPISSTYRSPNKVPNNVITLSTLKDMINEIYKSKSLYDAKCIETKMPKETMEQHMYTYLNKKYGLKNLIIEWARNIITGIKLYSKEDSSVLLFGKIMRNEQEEDARFAIEKINESISDLLLYYIKSKNPLKSLDEVNKMLKNKKNGELLEEEWKGIIYYIYEIEEAKEIEVKIEQFINRKFNEKKYEYSNKTTMNTIGNNNRKTTTICNTVSNTNTISNYYNGNNTISSAKKLSREERYNMVSSLKINNSIQYKEFIKIVLDYHIRLRDKQLKTFVNLFRRIDKDKNGVLNEEEFTELVRSFRIYNEEDLDSVVFKFLTVIDPYENQKITFSECVSLFSLEMLNEGGQNVSLLEKVCFGKTTLSVDSKINTINTNSDNRVGDS